MDYIKPNIVISRCLEFDRCRYNGDVIPDKFIRKLIPYVNFTPVCPEVEIGLGTPRDPIRLVGKPGQEKLIQPSTEKDVTEPMKKFAVDFLSKLKDVDGFVMKSRSPSCGVRMVKVYPHSGKVSPSHSSPGMFSEGILKDFPDHPIEEEVRFNDEGIREHWLTAIFTLAAFRGLMQNTSMKDLYEFQARYKYLLMAYNQTLMRKLGNLVANHDRRPPREVAEDYLVLLRKVFLKRPRYTSNINVHMHVFGYFSNELPAAEKAFFMDLLEKYREMKIQLSVLNTVMRSYIIRFDEDYLSKQMYFSPFPEDLIHIDEKLKKKLLKG